MTQSGSGALEHVALGCATVVGAGRGVAHETAVDVLQTAYDTGIRFFDTASMYSAGQSERLLGEVLGPLRSEITLLTKGGVHYPDLSDLRTSVRDSSYAALRRSLEGSLARLRTDHVDVYLIHQQDPSLAPEAAMENLQRLVDEGLTGAVGFSNFGPEACRRSLATGIPSYVEYSMSLLDRRYLRELEAAGQAGCRRLTYGTFVHGLLAEPLTPDTTFLEADWRHRARTAGDSVNSGTVFFAGDAYADNLRVAGALRSVADGLGLTLATLVLAVTRRDPSSDLTIIGCRSVQELRESLHGLLLELDDATVSAVADILATTHRPNENQLEAV